MTYVSYEEIRDHEVNPNFTAQMIELRKFCVFLPEILAAYLRKVVLDEMNVFPNIMYNFSILRKKILINFYYTDVVISDSISAHNLTYFTFQCWLACL